MDWVWFLGCGMFGWGFEMLCGCFVGCVVWFFGCLVWMIGLLFEYRFVGWCGGIWFFLVVCCCGEGGWFVFLVVCLVCLLGFVCWVGSWIWYLFWGWFWWCVWGCLIMLLDVYVCWFVWLWDFGWLVYYWFWWWWCFSWWWLVCWWWG